MGYLTSHKFRHSYIINIPYHRQPIFGRIDDSFSFVLRSALKKKIPFARHTRGVKIARYYLLEDFVQ
ncbi:TPA: hypothetical protein MHT70_24705 [Klebsiella pneumoniae]|nr:hypothetical protein [Klebsiella pneumoniae]